MSDQNIPTPQEQLRREITAEEFIKIWKGEYEGVEGYSEFYRREYSSNTLTVVFDGYKIIPGLEVSTIADLTHIKIINTSAEYFNIYNSKVKSIEIIGAYIESVHIRNSSTRAITIGNTKIYDLSIVRSATGSFDVWGSSNINELYILETELYSFIIDKSIISEIRINKSYTPYVYLVHLMNECKSFVATDVTINEFKLNIAINYQITIHKDSIGSTIGDLDFMKCLFPKDASLNISDTNIGSIRFHSFLNSGVIILNNIKPATSIKQFILDSIGLPILDEDINERKFKYEFIKNRSVVELINSDLGNTQFIGCDLASFDRFIFKNSKMATVFLADTKLPHRNAITTTDGANLNEQRRLVLSQFKKIYEGQGDMVRAAEYRAEEMEVYRSQLSKRNKLGTWLILSLSHFTSSYGQSIWRPIFWLFCGHYLLFMWALGEEAFGKCTFQEIIYSFFYLMNPIHQYIFKNDWTILIDACMRIWSSYMIYNFIRASRRFIK